LGSVSIGSAEAPEPTRSPELHRDILLQQYENKPLSHELFHEEFLPQHYMWTIWHGGDIYGADLNLSALECASVLTSKRRSRGNTEGRPQTQIALQEQIVFINIPGFMWGCSTIQNGDPERSVHAPFKHSFLHYCVTRNYKEETVIKPRAGEGANSFTSCNTQESRPWTSSGQHSRVDPVDDNDTGGPGQKRSKHQTVCERRSKPVGELAGEEENLILRIKLNMKV
ncbi:hypothetical protein STEG23_012516, partial [Scotinomys teguina]